MKRFTLPGTEIKAPAVVLGLMHIAEKSDEEIRTLVRTARDVGIDFIDHADVYGTKLHECESRFAEAMQLTPSERDTMTIQTKAGVVWWDVPHPYFDASYDHLVGAVEGSLMALNTDRIDILLLHRPDALCEPEEVARAFDHLETSGKVRAFGVSNHTTQQLELLRRYVRQPIAVNQIQLSLTHAPTIAQGLVSNMADEPESVVRDGGGIIDYCRLNDIAVQAWSAFQIGYQGGTFLDSPDHDVLNAVINRLAAKYEVPPIAIATAWITRHPALMQVVLGTTTPERVLGASLGSDLLLDRDEWYELYRAAGHRMP